jgi:LuxR family maltose regulon positive regulatory protein
MSQNSTVLRAKLLEDALEQSSGNTVLLIAPVGFGKTSLMLQHQQVYQNDNQALNYCISGKDGQWQEQLESILGEATPLDTIYLDDWDDIEPVLWPKLYALFTLKQCRLVLAGRHINGLNRLPASLLQSCTLLGPDALAFSYSDIEYLSPSNYVVSASQLFSMTLGCPFLVMLAISESSVTSSIEQLQQKLIQHPVLHQLLFQEVLSNLNELDSSKVRLLCIDPLLPKQLFTKFEQLAMSESVERLFSGLNVKSDTDWALLPVVQQVLQSVCFREDAAAFHHVYLTLAKQYAAQGDVVNAIRLMMACGEVKLAVSLLRQQGGLLQWIRHGLGNLESILLQFSPQEWLAFDEIAWLACIVSLKRGDVDKARKLINRHYCDDSFDWSVADAFVCLYEGLNLSQKQRDFFTRLQIDSSEKLSDNNILSDDGLSFFAGALINNILLLIAIQQGAVEEAGRYLAAARAYYQQELDADYGEAFLDIHQSHISMLKMEPEVSSAYLTRVSTRVQSVFSQDKSIRVAMLAVKRELAFYRGLMPSLAVMDKLVREVNHSEAWFDLYAAVYTLAAKTALHYNKPESLEQWLKAAGEHSQKHRLAHLELLLNYLARLAQFSHPMVKDKFESYIHPLPDDPISLPWRLLQLHLELQMQSSSLSDELLTLALQFAESQQHGLLACQCRLMLAINQGDEVKLTHEIAIVEQSEYLQLVWQLRAWILKEQLTDILDRHNRTRLIQEPKKQEESTLLSAKETAVMALVSCKRRNKEIAIELDISEQTVKFHLKSVYRKLGVSSRKQAVVALAASLVEE